MVEIFTLSSLATTLVDIPAVSMPIAHSVTKLHILDWSFIVPSRRCTCTMIMLFNHLLDMPHLSGGQHLREIRIFVHVEHFWDILFQHETWEHFTCCIYIFVQCSLNTRGQHAVHSTLTYSLHRTRDDC